MPSETMNRLHQEVKKHGVGMLADPTDAQLMDATATLRKWLALEQSGAVRLFAETDHDWEPGCDCGEPDCASNDPSSEAFGTIGQYRTDFDREYWDESDAQRGDGTTADTCRSFTADWEPILWTTADSVWGNVGYKDVLDWRENCYILGIMAETIDAFRDAWKAHVRSGRERRAGLCPTCHGTGKAS